MNDNESPRDIQAPCIASSRLLASIASVSQEAEKVFGDRNVAAKWFARPKQALGRKIPIQLCETEIGAKQVRRVLNALDSGGVV